MKNYGDISVVEKLDYADFWTYSFPCQDISIAGNQAGINKNTRSGLLYQVERLLNISKENNELPRWLMLENVKNLVGKKFKSQFDEWINTLDELGYNTYWQVLNAKNYGVPQNRERVFAISIRKDIDTGYEFPIGFNDGKRLKDILESKVDEKYYLSSEYLERFIKSTKSNEYPMGREYKVVGSTVGMGQGTNSRHWVYDTEYYMSTLDATMYKQPKQLLIYRDKYIYIRKLTPLECWRLMGFNDEQFRRAAEVNSNSQLYKQAGNSIVVDVLYYLFKNLFISN